MPSIGPQNTRSPLYVGWLPTTRQVWDIYTRVEKDLWPDWLQEQFVWFVRILNDIEVQLHHHGTRPTNRSEQLTQLKRGLKHSDGVRFYLDRPFMLGGPLAHPHDIEELLYNTGLLRYGDLEFNANAAMTDDLVKDLMQYTENLASHVPDPRLAITSGSARLRLEAIGRIVGLTITLEQGISPEIPRFIAHGLLTVQEQEAVCQMYGLTFEGARLALTTDGYSAEYAQDIIEQGGMPRWTHPSDLIASRGFVPLTEIFHSQGFHLVTWHPDTRKWLLNPDVDNTIAGDLRSPFWDSPHSCTGMTFINQTQQDWARQYMYQAS